MKYSCVLITLIVLILTGAEAHADYAITFKDGSEAVWKNILDEGDYYCTSSLYGKDCLPKKDILSVKEISEKRPSAGSSDPSASDGGAESDHGYTDESLSDTCRRIISNKYAHVEFVVGGGGLKEEGGKVWFHVRRYQSADRDKKNRVSYFAYCVLEKKDSDWQIWMRMKEM